MLMDHIEWALIEDAKACDRIRPETAPALKIHNL
jgi:hypothetical protein